MTISFENGIFIARSIFDENDILKGAGFKWNPETKRWYSESHHVAEKLLKYCDNTAIFQKKFAVVELRPDRSSLVEVSLFLTLTLHKE